MTDTTATSRGDDKPEDQAERETRAKVAADLRRAAGGHREYARSVVTDHDEQDRMEQTARAFETAASVAEDPLNVVDLIPSWRWTAEETASVQPKSAPEPVTVRMADYGEFHATRVGMIGIITEVLDLIPADSVIVVDWDGVEMVTGAAFGEYAAWFIPRAGRTRNRGMNDEARETYDLACRRLAEARMASVEAGDGPWGVRDPAAGPETTAEGKPIVSPGA